MDFFLVIVLVVVAIGAFLLLRKPAEQKRAKQKTTRSSRSGSSVSDFPYQSVAIMTAKICCEGATGLQGKRFLVNNAPKLPLSQCTSCSCKCGYVRHSDRREDSGDRRAMFGLRAELHSLQHDRERRTRAGRRSVDLAMA